MYVSRALGFSFTVGELIMVAVAFGLRSGTKLQHALYWPLLALQIPLFFVKESSRWLISKGRIEEAKEQIAYMARVNGKVYHIGDIYSVEMKAKVAIKENNDAISANSPTKGISYLDLFRPAKMLFRSLILFIQWFSVTALFYTLTFGSTSISGDPYTNFAFGVCFQIPAILISIYVCDRLGRRFTLSGFMTAGGLLALASGLIVENKNLQTMTVAMFSVARLCGSVCFGCVYFYAAEMYPTKIRGSGIGTCSTVGRMGGVFGLSIDGLKSVWYPLPFVIIGTIAIIAGLLALFLPETTGEKLPENPEQALKIGQNYKLVPWTQCSIPQTNN